MALIVAGWSARSSRRSPAICALLPDYARPVFLRVAPSLAVTATFKHRKRELAEEGL